MALKVKGLEDALIRYLVKYESIVAVEIMDLDDRKEWRGYCETCEYEQIIVDIEYKGTDGHTKTVSYEGSFGSLMYYLTDDTEESD